MTKEEMEEKNKRLEMRYEAFAPHKFRIEEHYAHAREKHPYFCDKIAPVDLDKEDKEGLADYREAVKRRLSDMRSDIEVLIKKGDLNWNDLALCELWEVDEAIANGDTAHAVEECYDAIAVLLRTIDVLEGRQELGKPQTISGNDAEK